MYSKWRLFTILSVLYLCAIGLLFGQTADQRVIRAQEPTLNERLNEMKSRNESKSREDYRLGPGDVIETSVFSAKELNKAIEITSQGNITLPFIGKIQVEGLTAQELEKKLESLLDARVVKNPQVSVTIRERHSQPVYILGAVQRPGTYQLVRRISLIDALSLAGGFNDRASGKVYLRKAATTAPAGLSGEPNDGTRIIEVDIKDLLASDDERSNYLIEAGDVISVPLKVEKVYYVLGDVNKPGAYELKEKEDAVRLSQALATAGGLLNTAALKEAVIVRLTPEGKKTHLPVNIKTVLKGASEDLLIKPNDLIFVPNSASKHATQAILNGLSSIVTAGMFIAR